MSHSSAIKTSWRKWLNFCVWIPLSPNLASVADPIPYLQIFVEQVRLGILKAGGADVQNHTVEGYLCDVAQIFTGLGGADPRLDHLGRINFFWGRNSVHIPGPTLHPPASTPSLSRPSMSSTAVSLEGTPATTPFQISSLLHFILLSPQGILPGGCDARFSPFQICNPKFSVSAKTLGTFDAPLSNLRRTDFAYLVFNAWENGLTGGAECGGEIGAMDGSPTGRCIDGAEG